MNSRINQEENVSENIMNQDNQKMRLIHFLEYEMNMTPDCREPVV